VNWASTCTSTSAVRDGIREDRDMELEYCSGPRHKSDTNRTPTWKQTRDTNGTQTAHKLAHNWGYDKYVQHKAPGPWRLHASLFPSQPQSFLHVQRPSATPLITIQHSYTTVFILTPYISFCATPFAVIRLPIPDSKFVGKWIKLVLGVLGQV
jgi:hypothetical protein